LNNFCKEQDLEICAIELHIPSYRICIVTVYRSPSGDFIYFLNTLEKILNKIYNNATDIMLCGDFNVNYHKNSSFKKSIDSLLTSYGISSVVTFSTTIQKESRTLIDNIFFNTSKFKNYTVNPIANGLSNHDAQCIIIHDLFKHKPRTNVFSYRKFDQTSMTRFNNQLGYELWDKGLYKSCCCNHASGGRSG